MVVCKVVLLFVNTRICLFLSIYVKTPICLSFNSIKSPTENPFRVCTPPNPSLLLIDKDKSCIEHLNSVFKDGENMSATFSL